MTCPGCRRDPIPGLMAAVVNLHGYDGTGVRRDVAANAFGPHSATPYLIRSTVLEDEESPRDN
jgi:hypothetical protein